ncbi:MAG: hypothetical protein Q9220_003285 [cf. Caloplaca sp. 1 TL-2023]
MPSNKQAPVIDFSNFLSGEPARVKECAEQIRSAAQKEGFFQIINHPITRELQQKTFEQQKKFFSLPLETKLQLDKAQNDYNRGYEVVGAQQFEVGTTELKEGFYVARDLPLDHPAVQNKKFGHGPNLWPESLGAEFRETCMEYLNQVIDLAEKIMQALGIALEIPQQVVDSFCSTPMAFGAHRDFGIITLLLQGDVPGLEVWDEEAQDWYAVPPVDGAYVVNMGNLFARWTNDQYGSSVHRVIHNAPVDRYSIAFNYNGNPDFEIKCIDSCRSKEEKYAPIAVEDAIREKYKEVYKAAGIYKVAEPTKAH